MALRKVGVIFTAEGYAEYLGQLKTVNQEMRTLATESKLAVAQLGNNASITDTYKTKMQSLNAQMDVSKDKTKLLSDQQKILGEEQKRLPNLIDQTNKKWKESDAETKKLKASYEELVKTKGKDADETKEAYQAYQTSAKETKALKAELKDLELTYASNAKELEKLPNELAKAELATQKLRNEAEKLHTEYRNAGGDLANVAKQWQDTGQAITKVGDTMQQAGGYMTSRFTVPIVTGLGYAVNSAKTFQSEMGAILPLIAEGGNITQEHRNQVEQLGTASRNMAIEYGKNTSDINAGMAELIRNGYSSSQVLGMLPNVLDASLASGEQFGTVMSTTANVLSQFELKGRDTNETLANTQRVVDSLTYVANATSSGFYDLGQGMAYVGPVANTLNMSVEETASILGILSDNGIEASQGGTALRGALTRLLNPSKQNSKAMEELGINTEDYKNGLIDFPTILDTIAKNTKDLTAEQKAALIAQAFGTESQSAMNALVTAGGDALRDMTSAAEDATGATKEIANAMRETPEFKFDKALAQLRDVGIEIGSKLLPHVTTAISAVGDWIESFNNLSDSTQNFIIKSALVVAAIGPILTILGKVTSTTGNVVTGIGKLIQAFGFITTPKSLGDMNGAMTTLATSTGTATNSVGLLGSILSALVSPTGLAITAIAGVYGAYMLLTQESRNAHNAMLEFPDIDGVTHEQAESIRSTYDAYSDLTLALETLSGQTVNYADTVASAVSEIVSEIGRINKENIEGLSELYDSLPPQVAVMYDELMQQEEQLGNHRISRSKQVQDEIYQIMDRAREDQRNLTDAEQQYIIQARNELARLQAESLGASAEQSRQIYDTLTADLSNMNKEQLMIHGQNVQTALQNMDYGFQQQKQQILDTIGETHPEVAQAMIRELELVYDSSRQQMMSEWVKTLAQQGDMVNLAGEELYQAIANTIDQITGGQIKLLPSEIQAILEGGTTNVQAGVDNMIQPLEGADARVMEAAQRVNKAIMDFANQKGVSVENLGGAEIDEFIGMIDEMGVTWHDLKFLSKSPHIDDNTKEFIERVVEAHGGWDAVMLEAKNAEINVMGMEELEHLVSLFGIDFASLTDEQKEALVNANGAIELTDLIAQWGYWSAGEKLEAKQAAIESDAALSGIKDLLVQTGLWNNIEFVEKLLSVDSNSADVQSDIANLISEWTGIPVEEIKQLLTNTNAPETTEEINAYSDAVSGARGEEVGTFTTVTAGVGASASEVERYADATNSVPVEKSSSVKSNIFSTIANTIALMAYNTAVNNMSDKTSTATTVTPNLPADTKLVDNWNTSMKNMFNKTSTATTRTPGLPSDTNLVNSWTQAMRNTFNKTSTLTTRTPSIGSNTNSVWSWISALNSAYSTSSTFTTYRRTVYQTIGRAFAEGGHITAFADGGNIQWGGMFASGGNVPKGFMGIVGEAGPELFHVTDKGVSITPLAPNEKMRGIEGAIEDFMKNKGAGGGAGDIHFNVEINHPVIREDNDIKKIADETAKAITKAFERDKKTRKGSAVGFA